MAERPAPRQMFTVPEAQAVLPKAIPLLTQLQGLQRSILQTNTQLHGLTETMSGGNGYPIQSVSEQVRELTTHQLQLVEAFQSVLGQLGDLGCLLKDVINGLLDFYSVRDGKIILLCWKLGEPKIQFWHTLEVGFAGRQPL